MSHTFGVRNIFNQIEVLSTYFQVEKQIISDRLKEN